MFSTSNAGNSTSNASMTSTSTSNAAMSSMTRLRSVILNALSGQASQQDLFDELMMHKPQLLKVFDVGNRDPGEQRELESGKTFINGKPVAINTEFARQAIFLAQQLECSERYVAGILHSIMSQNPNSDPVNCLESTVAEFHLRRRHLVESMRYLLNAAEMAEERRQQDDSNNLYHRISSFIRQNLVPGIVHQNREVNLAFRIFQEIEHLGTVLLRADNARKNAKSNTVAGTAPELGSDILDARYDSLKYERRYLASCLFLLARLGHFSPNEIKVVVEWLSNNPNHPMTYYMLASILAAFDPADPSTHAGKSRVLLVTDRQTLAFMKQKLSATWKDPGIRAVVLLKWTLFLTQVRHGKPELENREGFRTEELEGQIRAAVTGDSFAFLATAVLQLNKHSRSIPSLFSNLVISNEQMEMRDVPAEDFRAYLLQAFETLVRSLITHASSELRKIKQRQEDIVLAVNPRQSGSRFAPASNVTTTDPSEARNDIAMLYSFIGLLYSSLPEESALQFWGSGPGRDNASYLETLETTSGKLPSFLQWAVWSTQPQDSTMSTALYDMLAGLGKGQQCSELAYNFMARGGNEIVPGSSVPSSSSGSLSWDAIFGLLDSWAALSSNPAPNRNNSALSMSSLTGPAPQRQTIGPKDVLFAQAFLRFLSCVVTYSVAVRTAISGNAHLRAIPTLVSLIPLPVPLELKGALFDTLSAFCEPGAGSSGAEICKAVWTLMERLEVINVRGAGGPAFGTLGQVKGVEVELEEIEAVHGLYPATLPFLRLLATLIHTPKRVPLKDRVHDSASMSTTPENLGQPYRLPGIGPFTNFVVDNVFARIPAREYLRPGDRWEMNDLCLCFVERALAGFDLESLLNAPNRENVAPLLVHPGYDVMKRLLTNSSLLNVILSYIVDGVEVFEKVEEYYFQSTIVRTLRIVLRVLEIQDIFLEVLVPMMGEMDSSAIVGTVHQRSFFTKLDNALSFGPQYVAALAAYVAYPAHPELVLLTVKILDNLSSSSSFVNMAALIERSNDSDRILSGFLRILGAETFEDVGEAEGDAEQSTGAGAPDTDSSISMDQAIRLATLQLLIRNTESHRPFPNIAHFLLFGSATSIQQIQDPHALGGRQTSIHVLLELLNTGIPRRGKTEHDSPLFVTLPGLGEKCYRVIYQLCAHPKTSEFTMRYLRTREDFFYRHLAAIPSRVPETLQEPSIEVLYEDGARVITTVPNLTAFLRLRSWIFDLVALDLHILTNKGHHKAVSELLDVLFGNEPVVEDAPSWEDEVLRPFREVGQSHKRIIEFVQSLAFDWADNLEVQPVEIQLLRSLNLGNCIRTDAWGCAIVDREQLVSLITGARRSLHLQNTVLTPSHIEQLNRETNYILESCVVENHRREVVHATGAGYESWRRLLDTTLIKCFDRLGHDQRETMLFDLLHVLPPIIASPDLHESTAILISEAVLSCITKLREDRRDQFLVFGAAQLPADRLYAILRSVLACVMESNRVELVRGNLYATLMNYVHLISAAASSQSSFNGGESLSASTALVPSDSNSLQLNSLALIKAVSERLVTTIARDAIDGTEVWRTVAFMLMDSLIQLSGLEKQHVVLTTCVRHGILANFVAGVKESDLLLQGVLKPDPDDLNPLYVYEAKMSLFVRMAQTRVGAERLLEAQLIPVMAQCDYLDARPEADQSFMDQDTFLPSAIQRYHQLFMPTLQLANALLATLGVGHVGASQQALEFLSQHSATIVILLKNDLEDVSMALIEEIHLLVSLGARVLPHVGKVELASTNSGFGAIHAAILGVAARCLGNDKWLDNVRPYTDPEVLNAGIRGAGYGTASLFDLDVRRREHLLRQSLVAYLGSASDFTEPELNLMLSPLTTAPKYEERGAHFLATIPSIGDALTALNDLCNDLTQTLRQISDIAAELGAKDHVAVDSIHQIVRNADAEFIQNLDMQQKRALVCRELAKMQRDCESGTRVIVDTVEMLLLLLWRHILYYSENQGAHKMDGKARQTGKAPSAMRFLSTPEPQVFREEVGRRMEPVLQRIQGMLAELDENSTAVARPNQVYLDIMCRRLRDTVVQEEDEMGQ
ncbi:nucleoporin Nup186/Nup192/Nup205 [Mycena floridula]|nr:nucleoporin Nup186/Nup192/Nup205 [Mycena floridula]